MTDPHLKGFTRPTLGRPTLGRPTLTRRGFLTLSGAALALGATACSGGKGLPGTDTPSGGAGAGTGTIQFWTDHSDDEVKIFKQVITAFNAKHPDIKVNLLNIADAEKYYTKLNTAAVGGNLADVYYARTFDIASFAAKKRMIPVTDLVARDQDEVNPDDFWPAEIAQMTVDDQLYGLPYDFSNVAVYLNKTMFASAGVDLPTDEWTWDDFFSLAARFVQKDGKRQKRWGAQFQLYNWFMMGVFKANGGDTFSEDLQSCVISNDANVAFLNQLRDAMTSGAVPAPNATPAGVDPFSAQLVAMQVNGSWATASTRANVEGKFEWDVIKLPKGSAGTRSVSAAGGCWVIPPTSKNQEAAWTFVKHLASKESQQIMIVDPLRSIPGRQSSAADWAEKAKATKEPPASVTIFPEQMEQDAVNWAYPSFWTEFNTIWTNRTATLGTSGDPAKILQQIQDDTNKAATA